MNNRAAVSTDARQALASILEKYGRQVLEEPWRVQGLLNDYCPTRKREITALVTAQRERAVADLVAFPEHDSISLAIARWARQLYDRVGLAEPLAYWAVESWALALGVLSEPIDTTSVPLESPLAETVVAAADASTALEAAARSARQAEEAGQLGAAMDCLQCILEVQPGNADARRRLDRILAKRQEYLRRASDCWQSGQLVRAVSMLERVLSRFPDDAEISERLESWQAVSARALQAVNEEIPERTSQKRLHAVLEILLELERLEAPVQGLKEKRVALEQRFQAIEPDLRNAWASLNRYESQKAAEQCERVLAAIADHPDALALQERIAAAHQADQRNAWAIYEDIQAGRWDKAVQRLHQLPATAARRPPFDGYQRQVAGMTRQLLGYWRFLGAAGEGALLWILAGWLGRLVTEGLVSSFSQYLTGPPVGAVGFLIQMLLAALLLGGGGALIAGRQALASIPRNCLVAGLGAGLALLVAMVLDPGQQNLLVARWSRFLIEAFAAGLLIGLWLWHLPTLARFNPLGFGLATTAMAVILGGLELGLDAWNSSPVMGTRVLSVFLAAVNLCAVLAATGLVDRWWKFSLVPIGGLLACGLAIHPSLREVDPLLVMLLVGLILVAFVLALTVPSLAWTWMVGSIVVGLAVPVATQLIMKIPSTPLVTILMPLWSAAVLVQALRSTSQFNASFIWVGLRFLILPSTR